MSARVEKLFEGSRWAEGPAYFAAGRYLVWSDIPNDRILRWDEPTGDVGVFRSPAGYTNGHTVDREGRLVSCSHGARRVERTEDAAGLLSDVPERAKMEFQRLGIHFTVRPVFDEGQRPFLRAEASGNFEHFAFSRYALTTSVNSDLR